MKDPRQNELFDFYESFLSPVGYKRLSTSFYAVFRHVVLSLMPVEEISKHFNKSTGRSTKELYSMAGLILLKEFKHWTTEEAAEAYMFDARVQYALNLGRDNISLSERSLERYMKLMREDDLASVVFDTVTSKLIDELDIQIDSQRLDSTHIFSDMATFSRTKLMGVTIKRFLVQVKRHHQNIYNDLAEELRLRYEKNQNSLFADVSKDKAKRSSLRQDVAEEMYSLIQSFSGNKTIESMTTFKQLIEVFNQQCEVTENIKVDDNVENEKTDPKGKGEESSDNCNETKSTSVTVLKKTGGNVIQNPSDPNATYDGHKGVGYQVQIAETSNSENDVQLITSALPQTAVESDANAIELVINDLVGNGLLPNRMTADSLYGSDENVLFCEEKNLSLISPVCGPTPLKELKEPTEKQLRLQQRRKEQETNEWREEYNSRAQIEGTIGAVKEKTSMVRLRYRGEQSMRCSIYLKIAGWNISRATASAKMKKKIKKLIAQYKYSAKSKISFIHFEHRLAFYDVFKVV